MPILTEGLDIALSKVSWSPNGLLLAVGDVDGNIHIYEAGEVSHKRMYWGITCTFTMFQ